MDFMNLNQAAHGDREFGFICTRMGKPRKVVVGHWQDAEVQDRLAAWMRAAAGAGASQPEGRPVGRQHAAGGRDRRRQGRGPAPLRRGGQRLRRERTGAADHRGLRRRGRSPGGRVRAALHAGPGPPQRRRSSRLRCTMRPAPSWACGTSSKPAASRPLPTPSRTCTG